MAEFALKVSSITPILLELLNGCGHRGRRARRLGCPRSPERPPEPAVTPSGRWAKRQRSLRESKTRRGGHPASEPEATAAAASTG